MAEPTIGGAVSSNTTIGSAIDPAERKEDGSSEDTSAAAQQGDVNESIEITFETIEAGSVEMGKPGHWQ